MYLVKRIEIVANSFELEKILAGLEQSGVHAHTVLRNIEGKGLRAHEPEDLDTILGDNVYIIAFCMPDLLEAVAAHIRPLLNKYGGTCHISDAMEIRSVKCVAS